MPNSKQVLALWIVLYKLSKGSFSRLVWSKLCQINLTCPEIKPCKQLSFSILMEDQSKRKNQSVLVFYLFDFLYFFKWTRSDKNLFKSYKGSNVDSFISSSAWPSLENLAKLKDGRSFWVDYMPDCTIRSGCFFLFLKSMRFLRAGCYFELLFFKMIQVKLCFMYWAHKSAGMIVKNKPPNGKLIIRKLIEVNQMASWDY